MASKSPGQPYMFAIDFYNDEYTDKAEVQEQALTNETTNEQFSVEKKESKTKPGLFTIKIKRGMMTKKKK